MLSVERYGDVERLIMWTRRSASVGYHVSAYITRGVMVDTGFPAIGGQLEGWLQTAKPRGVIVTHAHEDHGGNVDLVAGLGIPMRMAPATIAELQGSTPLGLYRLLVWGQPRAMPRDLEAEAFDEPSLRMVHTPGHSVDHHVVWDAEREDLFAGDLFLGVKVRVVAPWEDPKAHVASLRAVIALRPKRLFDGHRGQIMDPIGALTAKADWMDGRIAAIEQRLAEGWSQRAIAREVLGREGSLTYLTVGEYSHENFVATVASPRDRGRSRTRPT